MFVLSFCDWFWWMRMRPHGCHIGFPHCPAIVQTTWLPHWLPPLSCHCSDHMAATLASPTALLWCRPHGCHIGFSHCPAMVQTTWLSHCTDLSAQQESVSLAAFQLYGIRTFLNKFILFFQKSLYFIKLQCWSCFYIFIMVFSKFLEK